MRWIFFSLVLINVAAAAWGFMRPEDKPAPAARKPAAEMELEGVPSLQLLGESSTGNTAADSRPISEIPLVDDAPEPLEAAGGQQNSEAGGAGIGSQGPRLCEILGPFDEEGGASELVERLEAIDVNSEVRTLQLPDGPGYWVYLPPEESRKAALRRLTELQARGVDSYVIPKGDLENGISLGMFSRQSLADARLEEMEAMGLEPELRTIERTYREIWVMLGPGEDEKMSDITWQRILEGEKGLERRENFCLDVASQDNIH